jgi:hypothetical protein
MALPALPRKAFLLGKTAMLVQESGSNVSVEILVIFVDNWISININI